MSTTPESPPDSTAPPTTDAHTSVEGLWFNDGTLVLQAGTAAFRVYAGFLAERSPVFHDMLQFPQPEGGHRIEDCPVVELSDDKHDLEYFLRALFDHEFFPPYPAKTDFNTMSGIIRLSTKYQVDTLRKRGLVHLSSAFPTDISQYSRWPETASWHIVELPEWIRVVLFGQELSLDWILPIAFYRDIPQCLECGAIGKYIKNEKCVNCGKKEKANGAAQRASQAQSLAVATRPGAFAARMNPPQRPQAGSSTQVIKRPLTSRHITVCIEAFHLRSLKAVGWLGSNSRAFPAATMFGDAMLELIQAFNASFDTRSAASLTLGDCIVRWYGNLGFHRNSDCGTVGEFYDIHFALHNSETFLRMPPKFKTTTQPAVALALFVDPIKFKQNHGVDPPPLDDKAVAKKQIKRRISHEYDEPQPKRHAPSKPLTSTFVPQSRVVAVLPPFSMVTLNFFVVDNVAGHTTFPWTGDSTVVVRLYDDKMSVGKDRLVYKMEIDGLDYVAKRCRRIPKDALDFLTNTRQLARTVSWLDRVLRALDAFYDDAEDLGVEEEVYKLFDVQPTFLAQEVLTDNAKPSIASGVSAEVLQAAQHEYATGEDGEFPPELSPSIVWLIQRCNGKAQDRWNLLKPQPLQPNKIDATLLSFAHFYWEKYGSKCPAVLSYFQAASGRMSNGEYGKLIFDALAQDDQRHVFPFLIAIVEPVRHADERSDGIQMVREMHQCNRICAFFGLNPTASETLDEDEGGPDEEG
ncbi:hypothetical protein C8R46DRAFT_1362338 [Mycena filopes]|nr:hypothetical protein C8R46DRAFT_1362338 [Mycena filopes]